MIYGLKGVAVDGPSPQALAALGLGLGAAAAFLHRQRTTADPLVDLALFRRPAFGAALAANTMAIFVVGGIDLFVAQHLQLVLGMGPLEAGLWTLPAAAAFVVGSMAAPRLGAAFGPARVMSGGLALAAAGLTALAFVGTGAPAALLMGCVTVLSIGVAPVLTLATDAIVAAAPPERAGAASALSETGTELGGALGIAVLGTIGAAVYRARMDVPDGVAPGAADAARETLGGAAGVADQLPAGAIAAANEAFAGGLQVAAGLTALAVAALAVVVAAVDAGADPRP